jgi:hypothetical protein
MWREHLARTALDTHPAQYLPHAIARRGPSCSGQEAQHRALDLMEETAAVVPRLPDVLRQLGQLNLEAFAMQLIDSGSLGPARLVCRELTQLLDSGLTSLELSLRLQHAEAARLCVASADPPRPLFRLHRCPRLAELSVHVDVESPMYGPAPFVMLAFAGHSGLLRELTSLCLNVAWDPQRLHPPQSGHMAYLVSSRTVDQVGLAAARQERARLAGARANAHLPLPRLAHRLQD